MAKVKNYHRPESVEEVLALLQRPSTTLLAGGTQLIANLTEPVDVIDLQAVGLNQIEVEADTITIGAMVRLQAMVEQAEMPELVRQMTLREGPNTFRHMGTLGGVVATADPESELYAALLVHEAVVTVQSSAGEKRFHLSERWNLANGELITAVTLQRHGQTASDRVARTPADRPIVAVVGRRVGEAVLLAACGVAQRPILINADEIDQLNPPADFRGSSGYRREMTAVLADRVLGKFNGTQRRKGAKKES
ncbi:MAG: FAD binding domain-containing protein [Ardenticatenaceae bacterium]|nr:FAD binding domain-containing protein [Ardenticatenaceae bacterium]